MIEPHFHQKVALRLVIALLATLTLTGLVLRSTPPKTSDRNIVLMGESLTASEAPKGEDRPSGVSSSRLSSVARANLLRKLLHERAQVKRSLDATLRTYVAQGKAGHAGEGLRVTGINHGRPKSLQLAWNSDTSFGESQRNERSEDGTGQREKGEGGTEENIQHGLWKAQTGMIPAGLRHAYHIITGSEDASPEHIQQYVSGTAGHNERVLQQSIDHAGKTWRELRPAWKPFNPYESAHKQSTHSGNAAAANVNRAPVPAPPHSRRTVALVLHRRIGVAPSHS